MSQPKSKNIMNYTDDMGVVHIVEIIKFVGYNAIIRFFDDTFTSEVPVERLSTSKNLKIGRAA